MLELFHAYGIDVKDIITAVVSAFVGAVFKWVLDWKEKARLRLDLRNLGTRLDKTHGRLAKQEAENAHKLK